MLSSEMRDGLLAARKAGKDITDDEHYSHQFHYGRKIWPPLSTRRVDRRIERAKQQLAHWYRILINLPFQHSVFENRGQPCHMTSHRSRYPAICQSRLAL